MQARHIRTHKFLICRRALTAFKCITTSAVQQPAHSRLLLAASSVPNESHLLNFLRKSLDASPVRLLPSGGFTEGGSVRRWTQPQPSALYYPSTLFGNAATTAFKPSGLWPVNHASFPKGIKRMYLIMMRRPLCKRPQMRIGSNLLSQFGTVGSTEDCQ